MKYTKSEKLRVIQAIKLLLKGYVSGRGLGSCPLCFLSADIKKERKLKWRHYCSFCP